MNFQWTPALKVNTKTEINILRIWHWFLQYDNNLHKDKKD